ncbi:ROK family transcriptional regulator [Pseudonocardiaceae bacterium YIM PH 21723]|nr:ROK family transcriptional regulator [Pseudonocardiaceae bacterium YIM PH 21723]
MERLRRTDVPSAGRRVRTGPGGVLRAVLRHGPLARSTLARVVGQSPASITGQSAELIEAGLLREAPELAAPKAVGRPHMPVDIDTGRFVAGALHIGVPYSTVALLDLRGRVLTEDRRDHRSTDPADLVADAADRLRKLLAAEDRVPLGVGVATGGWVDQDDGRIIEHPLIGWRGVPIGDLLAGEIGLPVWVDGHSRALTSAEELFGQGLDASSVVQLFIGNVVDAAFAVDGVVHYGPRSAAGGVAHLPVAGSGEPCFCGRTGCFQVTVSEATLVRRALAAGVVGRPHFPDLVRAAMDGSPFAVELFHERSIRVGRAVATLLDLLNPDRLILADAAVVHVPGCLEHVHRQVREHSFACAHPESTVIATSFREHTLSVAAGTVMLHRLYTDPLGVSRGGSR